MLSRRIGSLKISQGKHKEVPLLILEGFCDKDSADSLYKLLVKLLHEGQKKVALDLRGLQHTDIKCNMAISKAHNEFLKAGGRLILISNPEPLSKAMKIMRKNRFAGSF